MRQDVRSILQSRQWLKIICQWLLALVILYYVVTYIYTETYIWQVTSLGDFVAPVHRQTCELKPYRLPPDTKELKSHLRHLENLPATNSNPNSVSTSSKPLNIGILMLYSNSDGNWGPALMKRVLKNREFYSARYKYQMVTANDLIDKTRPTAWSKLKAMDHHLYNYDYLMYIDMDIVIMNFDLKIEDFIQKAISFSFSSSQQYTSTTSTKTLSVEPDFIMTEDWNGVNTGVWIVKNTGFSHWFLQTAWNQSQLIGKTNLATGIAHPFEYEQRAFHFLLNTIKWKERNLPHYRGNIDELRSHFVLLPQCAFNAYIMHPYYTLGNRQISHYVSGDFLVHFAGKKGKIKTNLMEYYLTLSEKKYT
jgi:hypothetical protein